MATVPGFGYGGVHLKGPCGNCGVPSSPQWRRGNEECPVLCNACGTWLKKNSTMRPLERIQVGGAPPPSTPLAAFAAPSCGFCMHQPPCAHPAPISPPPPRRPPRPQMSMQPKRSRKEPAAPVRPPKATKKPRSAGSASAAPHRLSKHHTPPAAPLPFYPDMEPFGFQQHLHVQHQQYQQYQQQHFRQEQPEGGQQQQQQHGAVPTSSSSSAELTHAPGLLLSDSSGSLDNSHHQQHHQQHMLQQHRHMRPPGMAQAAAAAAAMCQPPVQYGFGAPLGRLVGQQPQPLPVPSMFM
jgi:hypothetical protein